VYVVFWSLKGRTLGLWIDVLKLTAVSFPMIMAGASQRFWILLMGLQPARALEAVDVAVTRSLDAS